MSPRPYRLGKRETDIEDTRGRVIDAARELFAEAGFSRASLDDVAKRAGVSRATVYYQFTSKNGLLDATFAATLQRASSARMRRAREHRDAAKAVRLYVKAVCEFWSRDHRFFRNVIGLAAVEPEAREVVDRYDLRRKELIVWLVKRLDDQRRLRAGITERHAVDMLWLLTGFRSFDHMYTRSGLSVRAAAALLSELAANTIVEPVAAPG